jgi:uncharacterized protein
VAVSAASAPASTAVVTVAGHTLHLRAAGTVWWPEHAALLVADAHFGKAHAFRRLGVPVPEQTTGETLARLDHEITATQAQRVVFLGDFSHARHSLGPETLAALQSWRQQHQAVQMVLVRGNHDARAGDPPPTLGLHMADEPWRIQPGDRIALAHHPEVVAGAYVLAGHWHPCITLQGRARQRLRLPCFWLGDEQRHPVGVLPAFGAFTGMQAIERRAGDAVWLCASGLVAPHR